MKPVGQDLSVNQSVADRLREAADLLEEQQANPFRVGAYRRAAASLAALDRDLREIFDAEGAEGLLALTPGLGEAVVVQQQVPHLLPRKTLGIGEDRVDSPETQGVIHMIDLRLVTPQPGTQLVQYAKQVLIGDEVRPVVERANRQRFVPHRWQRLVQASLAPPCSAHSYDHEHDRQLYRHE